MQKFSFDKEQWGALVGRAREAIATDYSVDVPGRLELAELMNVHPNTIDMWETCAYSNPDFEHPNMKNMLNLCTLCGFDPARLFFLERK